MRKTAVFLDRDGVINKEVENLYKIEDLEILPGVPEAIHLLNVHKIPAIVATNQPVVARGWITEDGVENINKVIERILEREDAKITKFYFCPHHPNANLSEYRIDCDCRKPKTGLFERASHEFNIDLTKSYMVGDSFRDIEAAKNIAATSIAVECGASDFRDSKPDYKVKDLYEAVKLIISQI